MSCGHPCCNRVIIWRNVAAGYSRMYWPSCGLSCDTLIPLQTGFMVQIFRTHSGLPGDEGDLSRACNVSVTGSPFWWFFDQFFRVFSPVFPFATAVGELHKKAAPFSGRILFFSVVCQDGSHTFTGAELAGRLFLRCVGLLRLCTDRGLFLALTTGRLVVPVCRPGGASAFAVTGASGCGVSAVLPAVCSVSAFGDTGEAGCAIVVSSGDRRLSSGVGLWVTMASCAIPFSWRSFSSAALWVGSFMRTLMSYSTISCMAFLFKGITAGQLDNAAIEVGGHSKGCQNLFVISAGTIHHFETIESVQGRLVRRQHGRALSCRETLRAQDF